MGLRSKFRELKDEIDADNARIKRDRARRETRDQRNDTTTETAAHTSATAAGVVANITVQ